MNDKYFWGAIALFLVFFLWSMPAPAFTPNDNTTMECWTHYSPKFYCANDECDPLLTVSPRRVEEYPYWDETTQLYSGRFYALFFSKIEGADSIREIHGYEHNRIGDIVPLVGTELSFDGRRVISLNGLLRQHTQPGLEPDPFYHILRHMELPYYQGETPDGATGTVESANDNTFYVPYLNGHPVPRGDDGTGEMLITKVPCSSHAPLVPGLLAPLP